MSRRNRFSSRIATPLQRAHLQNLIAFFSPPEKPSLTLRSRKRGVSSAPPSQPSRIQIFKRRRVKVFFGQLAAAGNWWPPQKFELLTARKSHGNTGNQEQTDPGPLARDRAPAPLSAVADRATRYCVEGGRQALGEGAFARCRCVIQRGFSPALNRQASRP